MGVILSFAAHRRFRRNARKVSSGATGEVVIFTGVRYERRPEEAVQKPKRRAKPAKRKKSLRQG